MTLDISTLPFSYLTLLGGVTIGGYYMGGLARKVKLPSLIGYMILGVILGPSLFNLFNEHVMDKVSFITDICLGFVAFSIAAELNFKTLKRLGYGIISIIIVESFAAFFVVFGAIYFLTGNLPLALIFGAMAPASAPAGTVAVILECKSKGNLTNALYAVVGFDDGLAILIFGFAAALAKTMLVADAGGVSDGFWAAMKTPLFEIVKSVGLGVSLGLFFNMVVSRIQSSRELFIVLFGVILVGTGLSITCHTSLILTNMIIGIILVNARREQVVKRVTAPLMDLMPLMFVLFFCIGGAHLELSALPALGLIGVVYILGRSGGLIGGAFLGGMLGSVDKSVKKYIGLGILSQAGVAIGLALIVKNEFSDISPNGAFIGASVITTITATCIFFEIIGPILTKYALSKAGEIPDADK